MAVITSTGTGNYNVGGSWIGGVAPGSGDDAVIAALSVITIPSATTVAARSVTVIATGTLAFAATTSVINIGDATVGAGNVAFSNAGTITLTAIGTINFISTSTTQQTITSGGQTLPNLNFNGVGGKWVLQDALSTGAGSTTLTTGTLDTNSQSVTCANFQSTSSNTRVLTLGSSSISCSVQWNVNGAGMTLNAASSTITVTGGVQSFQTQGAVTATYGTVIFNGATTGGFAVTAGTTFVNLTVIGTAIKTSTFTLGAAVTVTGTLSLGGNTTQGVNRLLVQSATVGTQRTITATGAAVVISGDVDFMDINITGSPTWTNAGSAFVGDALGNGTLITTNRTTPATQTHTTSAGGNWSDATKWTSRVPLPQDNVVVNVNTTGTLTADMPRLGASIDFTGFAGSWAASNVFSFFGSLTIASGMTLGALQKPTLMGRGTHTITMAGKTWPTNVDINGPSGTYTLQDAFSNTTGDLTVSRGALVTNNQSVTCGDISSNAGTASITFGTSTVSITYPLAATIWGPWSGSATISAASATIVIASASTGIRTFVGNGQTYGTLTYTVANSPGQLTITGANTFTTLNVGSGRILNMPSSTTNTVTNFNVNGVNNGYLYLPGVASNYLSAPDSAALSITGDLDIRVKVALDDWTPAAAQTLVAKRNTSGLPNTDASFLLRVEIGGFLKLYLCDGATEPTATASVVVPLADGAVGWVRATWRQSDGRVQFFTSTDGAVWTQLGTNQTLTLAAIQDSSTPVTLGAYNATGSAAPLAAKLYYAQIRNNILDDGTGIVFDADFTTKSVGANTFTEGSSNAATVTINGSLAQAGDGRVELIASTPTSAATLSFNALARSDYLRVTDNTAAGVIPAYAGAHGVLVSNTTNWLAQAVGESSGLMLLSVGG